MRSLRKQEGMGPKQRDLLATGRLSLFLCCHKKVVVKDEASAGKLIGLLVGNSRNYHLKVSVFL